VPRRPFIASTASEISLSFFCGRGSCNCSSSLQAERHDTLRHVPEKLATASALHKQRLKHLHFSLAASRTTPFNACACGQGSDRAKQTPCRWLVPIVELAWAQWVPGNRGCMSRCVLLIRILLHPANFPPECTFSPWTSRRDPYRWTCLRLGMHVIRTLFRLRRRDSSVLATAPHAAGDTGAMWKTRAERMAPSGAGTAAESSGGDAKVRAKRPKAMSKKSAVLRRPSGAASRASTPAKRCRQPAERRQERTKSKSTSTSQSVQLRRRRASPRQFARCELGATWSRRVLDRRACPRLCTIGLATSGKP